MKVRKKRVLYTWTTPQAWSRGSKFQHREQVKYKALSIPEDSPLPELSCTKLSEYYCSHSDVLLQCRDLSTCYKTLPTTYHGKVILNCYSYINSKIKISFQVTGFNAKLRNKCYLLTKGTMWERCERQHLMLHAYTNEKWPVAGYIYKVKIR